MTVLCLNGPLINSSIAPLKEAIYFLLRERFSYDTLSDRWVVIGITIDKSLDLIQDIQK